MNIGIDDESVLLSIANQLGLPQECEPYRGELVLLINSAFSRLSQLGVGLEPFEIKDSSASWNDFQMENQNMLSMVKEYVYIRTRLIFDPPQSSYVVSYLEERKKELEWELNVSEDDLIEY